jgi:Protein of unknown function (DUF3489)
MTRNSKSTAVTAKARTTAAKRKTLTPIAAAKSDAATDASSPSAAPKPLSKQAQVIALLERPEGVALAAIVASTGWQPHSARAVLSGLRKDGYDINSDKRDGGERVYRIVAGPNGAPSGATA